MVKKRSNHIVLKIILDFEKVRIMIDFKINKSYVLIRLVEKFRIKKEQKKVLYFLILTDGKPISYENK
jgi:hypothetical protein